MDCAVRLGLFVRLLFRTQRSYTKSDGVTGFRAAEPCYLGIIMLTLNHHHRIAGGLKALDSKT